MQELRRSRIQNRITRYKGKAIQARKNGNSMLEYACRNEIKKLTSKLQ